MSDSYGLFTSNAGPVPLVGVRVQGEILGRGARMHLSQRFRNEERRALEAVYKFPLPEGSAVCGFKAQVDGRKIRGEIEEREKAFEAYDDALSKGHGGYLLDEERPNIFTLSVGNLNPGSEVVVEVEYVMLLDTEGDRTRFFLPTTIAPRYIPDHMGEDDGIPVDEKLHPPYALEVPYGLSVFLNLHGGERLESVESPSHQIKIENMKGDPVRVTFAADSVRMDRDFILYMDYGSAFTTRAYRHRADEGVFLQMDLCLGKEEEGDAGSEERGAEREDKEIVFLVDCSGSMSGDSIGQAKKALEVCVRALQSGMKFNIYRFGSTHRSLFPTSMSYDEASLKKAIRYLKRMDADLGGTEILRPLKKIYSRAPAEEQGKRDIILVTDGQVANEQEIFETVRDNHSDTRMFSIGIGAGCNEHFIKGISRAGRGASEFIYPGERIEPKVLRIFGKLTQESLVDPVIEWGTKTVEQAPVIPAIFLETPLSLFARCENQDLPLEKVRIRGAIGGEEKIWEVDVMDSREGDLPVPLLWARERIRDMEESGGAPGGRGSKQHGRKAKQWKEAILQISRQYGILSQSTSYVAIEEREEKDKTTGEPVLRKVPVPFSLGWHGMGSVLGAAAAPSMFYRLRTSFSLGPPVPSALEPFPCDASGPGPVMAEEAEESGMDLLLAILSSQEAAGGMKIDRRISFSLGMDFDEMKEAAADVETAVPVDKFLLLSTAMLLRVLDLRFASDRGVWEKVVQKSRQWLKDVLLKAHPRIHGKDLMAWVEDFLQTLEG